MAVEELSASEFMLRSLQHELLSDVEEKGLLRQSKAGDTDATNRLVKYNQRLVVAIAKKYHRAYANNEIELCDLVQAGNIGLYKAIMLWDAGKRVKFSTYAYYWIRAYVRRLSLHRSTALSVSYGFSEKLGAIRRARSELLRDLGQEPTFDEIVKFTGYTCKEVELGLAAIKMTVSLDGNSQDNEQRPLSEVLRDDSQDTETTALTMALLSHALKAIEKMPDSWRLIVRHRYGIDGADVKTQAQIGKMLGITRQAVDQIEKAALRRIRLDMTFPWMP
jgi:RNA polymerase sigma factor (sigma-70 family)